MSNTPQPLIVSLALDRTLPQANHRTVVYAPYSVRQADGMMEGLFAYKVQ
jgi:hypothetical protein